MSTSVRKANNKTQHGGATSRPRRHSDSREWADHKLNNEGNKAAKLSRTRETEAENARLNSQRDRQLAKSRLH